jgi:hypothetical protein
LKQKFLVWKLIDVSHYDAAKHPSERKEEHRKAPEGIEVVRVRVPGFSYVIVEVAGGLPELGVFGPDRREEWRVLRKALFRRQ